MIYLKRIIKLIVGILFILIIILPLYIPAFILGIVLAFIEYMKNGDNDWNCIDKLFLPIERLIMSLSILEKW